MKDSTYEAGFLPSEYYSATRITGKPLNIFSSLDYRLHQKWGAMHHRLMIGTD